MTLQLKEELDLQLNLNDEKIETLKKKSMTISKIKISILLY